MFLVGLSTSLMTVVPDLHAQSLQLYQGELELYCTSSTQLITLQC